MSNLKWHIVQIPLYSLIIHPFIHRLYVSDTLGIVTKPLAATVISKIPTLLFTQEPISYIRMSKVVLKQVVTTCDRQDQGSEDQRFQVPERAVLHYVLFLKT